MTGFSDTLPAALALIAERWDELPAWFGADWPATLGEVTAALHAIEEGPRERRPGGVYELGMLLRGHPALAADLHDLMLAGPSRGDGQHAVPPASWVDGVAALRSRLLGVLAEREVTVFAPHGLGVGRPAPLVVRFARTAASRQVAIGRDVPPRRDLRLVLHVTGEAIAADGPSECVVRLDGNEDVRVTFFLVATAAGEAMIAVDVLDNGALLATLTLDVTAAASLDSASACSATVVRSRLHGADLDLRIRLDDRGPRPTLLFDLHARHGGRGFHYAPVGHWELRDSPREYQARLLRRLEAPNADAGALRRIGQELWSRLPDELRRAYVLFRDARTLQVTSDEPWIPWELVCPYEDGGGDVPSVADEPWCLRFAMARWLTGRFPLPDHVDVTSMAVLGNADPSRGNDLLWSTREQHGIRGRLTRLGVVDWTPNPPDAIAVGTLLDRHATHIGLWHMAGHADGRGISLADGSRLNAEDIAGERRTAMARRRPLVVFNACRTAQQEMTVSGLGGWAEKVVRRCGAPFVGTQWDVRDDVAEYLITELYERLRRGEGMGVAMRSARYATRTRWPGDATWLAYSVYAHPATTVRFGSSAEA